MTGAATRCSGGGLAELLLLVMLIVDKGLAGLNLWLRTGMMLSVRLKQCEKLRVKLNLWLRTGLMLSVRIKQCEK